MLNGQVTADTDINAQCQYIIALFQSNATALGLSSGSTGNNSVWFGDQVKLPDYPAVCVEPGPLRREFDGGGANRRMAVNNDILIIAYIGKVQDGETNQQQVIDLMKTLVSLLHLHSQVGGMGIHSFVTEQDPGYATRAGMLLRAARITFNIQGQEQLPAAAN
jgi:hypothetical protein